MCVSSIIQSPIFLLEVKKNFLFVFLQEMHFLAFCLLFYEFLQRLSSAKNLGRNKSERRRLIQGFIRVIPQKNALPFFHGQNAFFSFSHFSLKLEPSSARSFAVETTPSHALRKKLSHSDILGDTYQAIKTYSFCLSVSLSVSSF